MVPAACVRLALPLTRTGRWIAERWRRRTTPMRAGTRAPATGEIALAEAGAGCWGWTWSVGRRDGFF